MESRRRILFAWYKQGAISKKDFPCALLAMNVLPDGNDWQLFVSRLLLWLGGLAIAFSVMFFIAYNWDVMGRFSKFALLETLVLACVLVYLVTGSDKVLSKVTLTVAAILIGVLFGYFGQTYQTGADPWELFASWGMAILPWAIVSQFAALWVLVVALVNVAMLLYYNAMGGILWFMPDSEEHMLWLLFIANTFIWLCWEMAARRYDWLDERWAVRLMAIISGTAITSLIIESIYGSGKNWLPVIILYALFLVTLFIVYRKRIPDLFMLAGLCLSVIVTATAFFADILFKSGNEVDSFFFLTILDIGMAAAAAIWLKKVYREQLS